MGAKGLKKIDNYMKKQQEIQQWKQYSNADDVEYMECQLEMEQEMLKVGTCHFGWVSCHLGKVCHLGRLLSLSWKGFMSFGNGEGCMSF